MANQNPIEYWKAAGIRALRTFVQTALGVLIANQTGINLEEAMNKNFKKKTLRDINRHKNNDKLIDH